MELMAAIKALKIPTGQEVQVYTDSKYVQLGITEWIEKWSKNNWKTSSKQKLKFRIMD
jgi:RNase HI (EC 3.1.26.4)